MGDGKISAGLPSAVFKLTTVNSKKILTASALGCIAWCVSASVAIAGGVDHSTLSAIEKRLFLKEYTSDSDESRVARLEKQAFGEPSTGDLQERLQKVMTAIGPQKDPDGSISGINPREPEKPVAAPPVQMPQLPGQDPRDISEDREAALERSQLAVQAAREESINKLLDQGVQLWRAKRGPQAIEKFEEVLRLDPHNAQANFSMGVVYEATGKFAQAANCYRRAAQEQPDNEEYLQAQKAIEKKAAANAPGQAVPGTLRALAEDAKAAFDRGEFMSALSFYKELDERVPNQALVKYNIGTCYMMTKNPITALEYYKQARKLKPDEPRYITAVDKLGANLQQAQAAREQIERQWAQSNPDGGGNGGMQMGNQMASSGKPKKQKKDNNQNGFNNGGGFGATPISPNAGDVFASLGLIGKSGHGGVTITTVGIASRASRVGLVQGDVIKAVDGTVVNDVSDINKLLSGKPVGSPVQMTVQRGKNLGQVTL